MPSFAFVTSELQEVVFWFVIISHIFEALDNSFCKRSISDMRQKVGELANLVNYCSYGALHLVQNRPFSLNTLNVYPQKDAILL